MSPRAAASSAAARITGCDAASAALAVPAGGGTSMARAPGCRLDRPRLRGQASALAGGAAPVLASATGQPSASSSARASAASRSKPDDPAGADRPPSPQRVLCQPQCGPWRISTRRARLSADAPRRAPTVLREPACDLLRGGSGRRRSARASRCSTEAAASVTVSLVNSRKAGWHSANSSTNAAKASSRCCRRGPAPPSACRTGLGNAELECSRYG